MASCTKNYHKEKNLLQDGRLNTMIFIQANLHQGSVNAKVHLELELQLITAIKTIYIVNVSTPCFRTLFYIFKLRKSLTDIIKLNGSKDHKETFYIVIFLSSCLMHLASISQSHL